MTDLEMTKLCAEAMDIQVVADESGTLWGAIDRWRETPYDPLHDDAQAMALVKKFRLSLTAEHQGGWIVNRNTDEIEVRNQWANRAVVEWVAKMQKAVQATHFLGA
jgi:hypothetical protein